MKRFILTCILIFAVLTGCRQNITRASLTGEYFGTVLTITLYGTNEKELNQIIEEVFVECSRMEQIFSAKRSDSELSQINQKAYQEEVEVSKELGTVLSEAFYYNEISQGALDVSVGKLINLWGIGTEQQRIPESDELQQYAGMDGCKYIEWNEKNGTLHYTDERIQIDLGAIAKGYAAGRVKQYILEQNSNIYGIIDFGGNIVTIGEKEDGSSWNVGITNPFHPGEVYASLSVKDKCIVTSGNYERYFERDGIRYHHILDPLTGYPAKSGVISATIIGADSVQCDALSTASFIMGVEDALRFIDEIDGVEAVFIDEAGNDYCTSGISAYNYKRR